MKTSVLLRASLLAAALGAALSAQAVTILLVSQGTGQNVGPNFVQNENVLTQIGGYGPLSTLVLTSVTGPVPIAGTGVYSGAGGTLNFSYSLTSLSVLGLSQSVSGTWNYTGGTGTYANQVGSGTLAATITPKLNGAVGFDTGTVFGGSLNPVPEPASMAVLGLGAAALIRRRKA